MKMNMKTTMKTTNMTGHEAYKLSPKMELLQRTSTWFVNEPKFYGSVSDENEQIKQLIQSISNKDPEFVLKLAVYCRETLLLRTAPIFMLVEASLIDNCKPYVRKYIQRVVTRADQLTETVAYLQSRIGDMGDLASVGSMPSALKRGLADCFNNFNAYQLAKYNRNDSVKLRDVICLTHPKPESEEQSQLFKSILENTLESPDTWEVIISSGGSTKENWEYASKKMGYMALLRNLRNFLEKGCDMDKIIERLGTKEAVLRSKQYPFRFLSAYNEIRTVGNPNVPNVMSALEKAMDISVENIDKIDGSTAIFADHSGSMGNPLSARSSLNRMQTADMLLAITHRLCDKVITGTFSNTLSVFNVSKSSPLIQCANDISKTVRIGGTNTPITIGYLLENSISVDRIIIITDEQSNMYGNVNQMLNEYRRLVNPNAYCYIINVAGYGTTEVNEHDNRTCHISGFTDKILGFVKSFETDNIQQLKDIESI